MKIGQWSHLIVINHGKGKLSHLNGIQEQCGILLKNSDHMAKFFVTTGGCEV